MSSARARPSFGTLFSLLRAVTMTSGATTLKEPLTLPAHHSTSGIFWKTRTFENIWDTWKDITFKDVYKWASTRKSHCVKGYLMSTTTPTAADFAEAFPPYPVDWKALANPPSDAIQAVWVGHSTVLTQMQGLTWITDPVFSERASPVQWAGPKRVTPPAFTLEAPALPRLDFVLISHNHYDHLDRASVKSLHARFGEALSWYVPLGLAAWFRAEGISNVRELDWWEEARHPSPDGSSVRLVLTPAQHATMRGLWGPNAGRRQTLWGGWAVLGSQRRFWFAGDTGYCTVFREIGERLGPFDLAAIPTAAYLPRDFMRAQHVNPAEAVRIHRDVRSRRSMAIHLATFPLTDEPMDEPVGELRRQAAAAGLGDEEFVSLRHGASIVTSGGVDLVAPVTLSC
ncbi:hypothetical protein ACKKBG_A35850 [Auxenochlorella protothecoides x Auxenochlorella symbiontica]